MAKETAPDAKSPQRHFEEWWPHALAALIAGALALCLPSTLPPEVGIEALAGVMMVGTFLAAIGILLTTPTPLDSDGELLARVLGTHYDLFLRYSRTAWLWGLAAGCCCLALLWGGYTQVGAAVALFALLELTTCCSRWSQLTTRMRHLLADLR